MRPKGWNKFHAVKTTVDGVRFDSKAEAKRWQELKLMERAGVIVGLQRQIPFPITVNSHLICTYIADYVYTEVETGERTVEDCKSKATITPEFRLKAKLLEATAGIVIRIHTGSPRWVLDASRGRWLRRTPTKRSVKTKVSRGATSPASF
jgi:hypothetical protein